jgi:hypothetical protein
MAKKIEIPKPMHVINNGDAGQIAVYGTLTDGYRISHIYYGKEVAHINITAAAMVALTKIKF